MWEAVAKEQPKLPEATVVLWGKHAALHFPALGPVAKNSEITTYHETELQNASDEISVLNTFRISIPDRSILDNLPIDSPCLVVVALSWLEPHCWSRTLAKLKDLKHKVLITTTDFSKLRKYAGAASAFNQNVDFCHQYLRLMALKMGAAVVYTTDDNDTGSSTAATATSAPTTGAATSTAEEGTQTGHINWQAVVSHILQIPISQSQAPAENMYGSPVVVYGNDTREKILTVNPEFPYDDALNGKWEVPRLVHEPEESKSQLPQSLPEEMAQLLSSLDAKPQIPIKPRPMIDGDDKKVISEFFSTIAERST